MEGDLVVVGSRSRTEDAARLGVANVERLVFGTSLSREFIDRYRLCELRLDLRRQFE